MDSQYASTYRDLYQRHWWWRAREEAVEGRIRRLALADARILDVGCGDALFFPRLEQFGTVEGLEADATLVSEQTLARYRVYVQPFDPSFQPKQRYDLILMLDVLEHLPDPLEALSHARELLAPGGRLLITVPALRQLWTSHDDFNQHRTRYHKSDLRRELEQTGFTVEDLRALFCWPVFGKLAVRLKERLRAGQPVPAAVPSALFNQILLHLTRLDVQLGMSLRLPFGSSLFALASPIINRPIKNRVDS